MCENLWNATNGMWARLNSWKPIPQDILDWFADATRMAIEVQWWKLEWLWEEYNFMEWYKAPSYIEVTKK